MKRVFDICASFVALLAFLPLMLVIAVVIPFTSPGPAVFRQTRVGRDGCKFTLYKFRSMEMKEEAERGLFEAGSSRRITPFGRFLRAAKLDELPQLWNVLKGDMSVVGPRPEVQKWVEAYPERWAIVHRVRPGITDPASILYRNEEELLSKAADPDACYRECILPHKLTLYEGYVRNHSLAGDVQLILRTVLCVLFHQGTARSSEITLTDTSQNSRR